jgi:uracil-DNA glycosylase
MAESPTAPPGFPAAIPTPPRLAALHAVMVKCTRCDLFLSRTRVVPGAGAEDADILIVGEAPGASEDRQGVPFVGRSGALLESMLGEAGLSRDEVFIANTIRCRPPQNRTPRAAELRACAGWLQEQVRILDPAIVVTLGRLALQHFLPSARVTRLQGERHEIVYGDRTLTLFPLIHPAAVLRNPELRTTYAEQFQRLGAMRRPPGTRKGTRRKTPQRSSEGS